MLAPNGRDDEHGHALHVLRQVRRRCRRPLSVCTRAFELFGRFDDTGTSRFAVQIGNLGFDLRVADDQPAAAGDVAARWGLFGEVNALGDDLVGNLAFQIETQAYGARGTQNCIDLVDIKIHGSRSL